MDRLFTRLFTLVNSGVGRATLLLVALCAPLHGVQAQMTVFSGNNQTGLVNTTLPNPLEVRFSGSLNATLTWNVTSGNATFQESGTASYQQLDGSVATTRGQIDAVHLVLGGTPGPVTVTATCGGCDTGAVGTFNETINGSNGISYGGGGGQSGQVNTVLPTPLSVSFSGVSNATLQWRIISGSAVFQENGGSTYTPVNGTTQTTAGQTSSVHLQLGNTAGPVSVTATCTSGCDNSTSQNFTETVTAAPTNNLSVVSGNNQSGAPNATLVSPLTVGFSGAPVGGPTQVQLDWQVLSGNATIQESSSGTYSQMLGTSAGSTAQIHLVLGASAGSVTVQATCSAGCTPPSGGGAQSVSFNETIAATSAGPALTIFSGDNQTGAPGSTLPQALEVLLTPSSGFTGGSLPVAWHVESGDATIVQGNGASYTDNVQITGNTPSTSQVTIALGPTAGAIVVSATCSTCTPQTRAFHLTSVANTTAQLAKVSGDNQTGIVGSASDAPLVVQLGTPGNTSLSGQPINWTVISGQATLSAATTQTDTNGLSQISFSYSGTPGPVTIEASSTAGKVDFTATGVLANIGLTSGNNQTAGIGTTLAPFVVQVSSTSAAKGLSGVPVTWKVSSGSGTLASITTLTNSSGQASNTLTLGNAAGLTTVTASIPGTGNVTTTFSARAISSASIATLSGDNQAGPAGTVLQPFVLQVVTGGQSAPGVTVDWTVLQGGGTLASATTISDASGHASNTLTLGSAAGVNVVRASIGGLGAISFTAFASTATGGNSQFQIVSGDNQALTPGQPSQPLVVKLQSAQGQPVANAVVQWAVSGQTGTLKAPNTATDANGQAQNTLTVILPGSYTVTAQIAGASTLPTLTFHLGNGVANLPGITPGQGGVANVIDKACPALAALPPAQLTPAQKDLLNRCTEIVLAAGTHPGQVPGALGQVMNNRDLPQRQLANTVGVSQFGNLNTRLAELRQGVGGFSAGGLSFVNDGRSLPLAMLGDMFRKDPKDTKAEDEVGKDFERWGFFATGMIERGGFDAAGNRPGFNFHNDSITAGVDYRFNADFVAGLALGYNRNDSNLDLGSGSLNADSYSLNGYFTWYHNNDFYIEGSLVLDWLSYDLSRNIAYQIADQTNTGTTTVAQTLSASPDGHQSSLSLSVGKDFARGAWSASPYLRAIYSHLSLSAFSETARDPNAPGSGLATSVESRSLSSALLVGGARISYTKSFDWGVLVPNAVVEWNHELKNDPQTVVARLLADPTQTPMIITDQAPDSNYFNLGIGLNAVFPKGRSGFLLWEHLTGYSGAHENRYSIGVRIEF